MKPSSLTKSLLILDLLFVSYAGYLTSCGVAGSTQQTCKGDPNLNTICVGNAIYTKDTSGSGTGCGPRCKLLVVNNNVYTAHSADTLNSDTSFLSAPPKTIELNGKTFEFADYEKEGPKMLDSKWLIINNRLYKSKK